MGAFRFLELPLELREIIYGFAFVASIAEPLDLLLLPGPDNALRRTCKAILYETTKTYQKLQDEHEKGRIAFLYELGREVQTKVANDLSRQSTTLRRSSVLLMGQTNPWCLHPCTTGGRCCYHCTHRAHLDCFKCGKWLGLAVYYSLHPDQVPLLVTDDGSGALTCMGQSIDLRFRHLWLMPSGMWRYGGCYSQDWWHFELERQRVVDRRCRIRNEAVQMLNVKQEGGESLLNEDAISALEWNRFAAEMAEIDRFVLEFCDGNLDWSEEWRRRSVVQHAELAEPVK
jgi:hypothetical protein